MTKIIKKFILLLVLIPLLSACNRDDNGLNDYDLFGRLQRGNGTWEVISITTRNNSEKSPTENDASPENTFYHFFHKTTQISGVLVDLNHAELYQDDVKRASMNIEAEPFRVVFPNGQVLGGDVWTVTTNKPNTQVWSFVSNTTTTTMTLERCKCDIPDSKAVESGG